MGHMYVIGSSGGGRLLSRLRMTRNPFCSAWSHWASTGLMEIIRVYRRCWI